MNTRWKLRVFTSLCTLTLALAASLSAQTGQLNKELQATMEAMSQGGPGGGEMFGFSLGGITTVGGEFDFNGDRYKDYVVGAPYWSEPLSDGIREICHTGKIYIYLGGPADPNSGDPFGGLLRDPNVVNPIEIVNPLLEEEALFGFSVSGAFDVDAAVDYVDQDGKLDPEGTDQIRYGDIIVGVPMADLTDGAGTSFLDAGMAWIIPGRHTSQLSTVSNPTDPSRPWIRLQGDGSPHPAPWTGTSVLQAGARFGHSVSYIGADDDGDPNTVFAFDDVLVGAPYYDYEDPVDPNVSYIDSGQVYGFGRGAAPVSWSASGPPANNGQVVRPYAAPVGLLPQTTGLFGYSVSGAGVFDQIDVATADIVVGEPGRNSFTGSACVWRRSETPAPPGADITYVYYARLAPHRPSGPIFVEFLPPNSLFGFSVADLGEWDNFFLVPPFVGFDDVVVGAPGFADPAASGSLFDGAAFPFVGNEFPGASLVITNLATPGIGGIEFLGASGAKTRHGWAVSGGVSMAPGGELGASAGALTNSSGEIIVGAPRYGADDTGAVSIYFGMTPLSNPTDGTPHPSFFLDKSGVPGGLNDGAQLGFAVSEAYDITLDPFSSFGLDGEFLAGAPFQDVDPLFDKGGLTVVLDANEPTPDPNTFSWVLEVTQEFTGIARGESLGFALETLVEGTSPGSLEVADWNGDGIADIVVGAPYYDLQPEQIMSDPDFFLRPDPKCNSGRVYILDGADGSLLCTLEDPTPSQKGQFGFSVAIGNFYGSSDYDVLVGAPFSSTSSLAQNGKVVLFDGALIADCDNDPDGVIDEAVVTLYGVNSGDHFGFSVANGLAMRHPSQAHDDFIVGSPRIGDALLPAASSSNIASIDLFSYHKLGSPGDPNAPSPDDPNLIVGLGMKILDPAGREGSQFGYSVEGAGSLNECSGCNELDDILVGAPRGQTIGDPPKGRVYVIYRETGAMTTITRGLPGGSFGWSLARIDDVNGNGRPEFLVGAPTDAQDHGRVFLLTVDPMSPPATQGTKIQTYLGEAAGDRFGWSVSGISTVDDLDLWPDVVIGAPKWGGTNKVGKVYFYRSTGSAALLETVTGDNHRDYFGYSVARAGQVHGIDAVEDLVIGAPFYDRVQGGQTLENAGKVYLYDNELVIP